MLKGVEAMSNGFTPGENSAVIINFCPAGMVTQKISTPHVPITPAEISDDELGRACHRKRMKMEQTLNAAGLTELKKKWYQSMCTIGPGRLVILYGRRLP